jgi:hypothetical protein
MSVLDRSVKMGGRLGQNKTHQDSLRWVNRIEFYTSTHTVTQAGKISKEYFSYEFASRAKMVAGYRLTHIHAIR